MLHAKLAFDTFDSPLDIVDGGIFLGGSSIHPVQHRLLRTMVLESPDRLAVIVSERFADDPQGLRVETGLSDTALHHELDRATDHLLDVAILTIDRRDRSVRYRASPVVAVPVYMTADARGVSIDWDYARLLAGRPTTMVGDIALAQIAGLATYGPATIVAGVYRATAGATLIATARGIDIEWPIPIRHDGPHDAQPQADIETMFYETIVALLDSRPLDRARTAVELSGGMDSALTALAAAALTGPGLVSVGAQFGGAMGDAQRERRAVLRERGGFDDLSIPAERFAPFAPTSRRRDRYGVWPEDESYPEMFEAIFTMLQVAGIDALVSGFGGDELYLTYEGEDAAAPGKGAMPPCPLLTPGGARIARDQGQVYPQAWLQPSCWQSAASQSQRLLRFGLWPIYPYLNIALARFVSRLPRAYRRDRRLLRDTLATVVGEPVFAAGYIKETFDPVARRGIGENRDYLVDLVERSPLSRHPDIDHRAIVAALGGDIAELDRERFNALFRSLKIACFFQSDG